MFNTFAIWRVCSAARGGNEGSHRFYMKDFHIYIMKYRRTLVDTGQSCNVATIDPVAKLGLLQKHYQELKKFHLELL